MATISEERGENLTEHTLAFTSRESRGGPKACPAENICSKTAKSAIQTSMDPVAQIILNDLQKV
jgi:hypothetical protein